MFSFEEVAEMLDDIANSLPKEIYKDLNGGINLLADVKMHIECKNNDLYILGDYHRERDLGRYINIYYGSIMRVYGACDSASLRLKLREILTHEFTHHLESMAGEKSLELEDARNLQDYIDMR